ncbi:MAG: hypothetical protein WA919_14515 [Coleofasciculaceae cyanobacterium]
MSHLRIVIGNQTLAKYLQGGGHWIIRIQYLLGLRALKHDVVLLELLWSSGNHQQDEQRISQFFQQLAEYGLAECCVLLLFPKELKEPRFESAQAYGKSKAEIADIIKSADLLWNDCCSIRQPLLGMFKHRVLIDLDPGVVQVSCIDWEDENQDAPPLGPVAEAMSIHDHHAFLTVGRKMNDPDCEVPTLGLEWHTFSPFVYLPLWQVAPNPGLASPFSSITHWSWKEIWMKKRILSTSKRKAYLRYLDLPQKTGRAFELAANIHPDDNTGDRELLTEHNWKLVDPWEVAKSPAAYQNYIASSRAEIMCPKPIFRELKSGWFSDRSACYLASGRPVLAEDTGFSDHLPTGKGLLAFRDLEEAIAGVHEIDANYPKHMQAARELAEELLDSQRCLEKILAACS